LYKYPKEVDMPHPRIRCQHCGHIITVQGLEFSDRASFEDSDLSSVHTFCPACEKLNVWNKDEVLNVSEIPVRESKNF
jgi:phage FluMu protein Com